MKLKEIYEQKLKQMNEALINEALSPKDKKALQAFMDKKSMDGKVLSTDGTELSTMGMGHSTVAKWKNGKLEILLKGLSSNTEQSIVRYLKKEVPKTWWGQSKASDYI